MNLKLRLTRLQKPVPNAPEATMMGFATYTDQDGQSSQLGPYFGENEEQIRQIVILELTSTQKRKSTWHY